MRLAVAILSSERGLEFFWNLTTMIKVKLRGNETAEQMLKRFKKACEKEGLTKDMKRVAYYEKPSEKRRRRIRKGPPLMLLRPPR